jgi:hypothetical protein
MERVIWIKRIDPASQNREVGVITLGIGLAVREEVGKCTDFYYKEKQRYEE